LEFSWARGGFLFSEGCNFYADQNTVSESGLYACVQLDKGEKVRRLADRYCNCSRKCGGVVDSFQSQVIEGAF
jgi:hypothetical protein